MGVPKFFRWLSERYPRINQPFTAPPDPLTRHRHFPETYSSEPRLSDAAADDYAHDHHTKCNLRPDFDRLYVDMNGIIHCCSHNNAGEDENYDTAAIGREEGGNGTAVGEASKLDAGTVERAVSPGSVAISEEQIFRNVCYYLDRVVTDIARPRQLVYLAIDGVAPRAKMNQQRSRRYRSGKEREIEATFYGAHLARASQQGSVEGKEVTFMGFDGDGHEEEMGGEIRDSSKYAADDASKQRPNLGLIGSSESTTVREISPGRFAGTFETKEEHFRIDDAPSKEGGRHGGEVSEPVQGTRFHSNSITPGTPFFDRCTAHLQHFVRKKLSEDPRWADLTVIFSGPDVPGEGEHKIMDFMRRERARTDYDPNMRHCLFGQDGDLIMLGLATHEPNFCLLREEVVFAEDRKAAVMAAHRAPTMAAAPDLSVAGGGAGEATSSRLSASLGAYIHNANFELLHLSILRDYLAYEFETSDVVPSSPFDIEATLDDFVFLTFFVGNDFLPHMPALDIGDEAFDLLFYTYKRHRYGWLKREERRRAVRDGRAQPFPYLTHAGEIVSGNRLEEFLAEVGSHEDPYYENKNRETEKSRASIRKADRRRGRGPSIPSDEDLWTREAQDRERYAEMLVSMEGDWVDDEDPQFSPVISAGELPITTAPLRRGKGAGIREGVFKPEEDQLNQGFFTNMSRLLQNSLSGEAVAVGTRAGSDPAVSPSLRPAVKSQDLTDLKGRYYYDKFGFTPVDAEKHRALRKAYIEGLVWNLEYYYKGCTSWEWYYPYHYGPMLSDLITIDEFLEDISFDGKLGEPLLPYEQLLGCLPPSSADLLPTPYKWLMKSRRSPILDFYPESFTVDMNGKRWPWEAVVLLPFIDSARLRNAARELVSDDLLTEEERHRNIFGAPYVFKRDEKYHEIVASPSETPGFEAMETCTARVMLLSDSEWANEDIEGAVFRPVILEGTKHPIAGFSTLKDAPVEGLHRRRVNLNVFGMRSRYRTAILEMGSALPDFPPASQLGPKFVGTTVFFRYPYLQEGFVTAVSDALTTVRGLNPARRWTKEEEKGWDARKDSLNKKFVAGEGLTGTGGWQTPPSNVTLCVRPLKEVRTMPDGTKAKVYAKLEVEVPLSTALWTPSVIDVRYSALPKALEKDPYQFFEPQGKKQMLLGGKIAPLLEEMKSRSNAYIGQVLPDIRSVPEQDLLPPLPFEGAKRELSGMDVLPPLDAAPMMGSSSRTFSTSALHRGRMQPGCIRHCTFQMSSCKFATVSKPKLRLGGSIRVQAATALVCATMALLIPSSKGTYMFASSTDMHCHRSDDMTAPLFLHSIRGGDISDGSIGEENYPSGHVAPTTPPIEFAHGTTTLSFKFHGGIIAAVDSRASIGSFVGSKTTQKVLPVSGHILGTMAGGAADCSFWIRKLRTQARLHEMGHGRAISVARASKILSSALYENRGLQLSVGTMIMGYDDLGPSIYYVDDSGKRSSGDMFAVGSGSTFALGILDTDWRADMTEGEAMALGIKAIRHATFRDAYSGGYIGVYLITSSGWRKVFSEDLANSGEV